MMRKVDVFMSRNERLRQQRIQHDWLQQEVADQLGVALVTVQRWERGVQQPSAYYSIKLCTLFNSTAQELGLHEAFPAPVLDENLTSTVAPPDTSATPDTDTSPSPVCALWTLPYARNPHFTGRNDLLDQLRIRFTTQATDQSTQTQSTQIHVLKGLGGIGKTQIAVEYAYRSREQERYIHTFWVNAASEETILTDFAALVEVLPSFAFKDEPDQHKLISAIIRWLEACPQPWLLIFDNADDLSFMLPYLPRWGNGSILLTTRINAVGMLASSTEVDCWDILEGTQFLLRRAQREGCASVDEINTATNITKTLAQFPLALDQAGAYIEETGCSLHDYAQIYQKYQYELLARRGKQVTQYPESVATTWSLSFNYIEQINPAAAELLDLCAFLSPDHIPEELFTEGAAYWSSTLQKAVSDPFTFNQMLELLLAFSLIKRLAENHLLSIHRLVQVVKMERFSPQEQRQWAERLIRSMHTIFPYDPKDEVSSWPKCQRYLEQAQRCDQLIQEHHLLLPEAAVVLERTGTYLCERALYPLAAPFFLRGLHIWEQQPEPKPLNVAASLNGLAHLYYEQGRYSEAELLREQALCILEQLVYTAHPHQMVIAQNGLACIYSEQGKYAKAEQLFLEALRLWEEQIGLENPQKADVLHGLATLYSEQGKYTQAESLFLQALRIREQQLGSEHLVAAYSLNCLAGVYSEQGKYTQAEQFFLRALRLREQLLGSEHPQVAIVLHGLATLYSKQGKYTQAEPLFQQSLYIQEQCLHSEHSKMAQVLHDFAGLRQTQGYMPEAVCMYKRALSIRDHVFGSDHPLTTETRERLHAVMLVMDRAKVAEILE
jgi:tetratricopeptide (TPR) repeat protein/transcriptional regulator with XRE-family HTH domain